MTKTEMNNPLLRFSGEDRTLIIDFEVKLLQTYGPMLNTYAIPNIEDPNVWNCLVFVYSGPFKGAKFKFDIDLLTFPTDMPKVTFTSHVFHPLVDEITGQVEIERLIGEWEYGDKCMLYTVFNAIKRMFISRELLGCDGSKNVHAAELYNLKPHLFLQRAQQSIASSVASLHDNHPSSSFIIKQYLNNQLETMTRHLANISKSSMSTDDKVFEFVKWVASDQP